MSTEKHYLIECSKTGYVTMSEKRLEELFDMMPTLRFILLGHPNMKQNNVKVTTTGMPILVIPDYLNVSVDSFITLVNCAFDIEPLPSRLVLHEGTKGYLSSESKNGISMKVLTDTITKLGGCDVLEQRLRNRTDDGPLTPEEDTGGKYIWSILHCSNATAIYCIDVDAYTSKGFSFAGVKEDGIYRNYFFRKKNKHSSNA